MVFYKADYERRQIWAVWPMWELFPVLPFFVFGSLGIISTSLVVETLLTPSKSAAYHFKTWPSHDLEGAFRAPGWSTPSGASVAVPCINLTSSYDVIGLQAA